jgi:hypothetical protein
MRRKTTQEFIEQAEKLYPGKYSYKNTVYIKNSSLVKIHCNLHNLDFEQSPANHLNFEGCPECFSNAQRIKFSKTSEQFIKDAQEIHGNKYDYSKTKYKSILEKVEVICPEHGSFFVYPTNHLRGCDCQKCGYNKIAGGYFNKFFQKYPEKKNEPAVIYFYKFERLDGTYFYKLGISTKIKYRYSDKQYKAFKISIIWEENMSLFQTWNYENILTKLWENYHYTPPESFNGKTECYSKEFSKPNFINIFDHEWEKKKEIIISRFNIKNQINQNIIQKIPARKTTIKIINKTEAYNFLEQTHIQGSVNCSIAIGLYFKEKLVSIMTFGKPRYSKYDWELLRFSSALNTIVVGGASRLFHFFTNEFHPKNVISYSDNRWNKGNIYETIGMKFLHNSDPNYWYIKDDKIYSRIKCQKHKLPKLLENFNPNQTELQNMTNNGFKKVIDNGNSVFLFENS